jgi:MFS family permease
MTAGEGPGWAGRQLDRYRAFGPDARRFLLVTLVGGAATSLWWIDFNLYLSSIGMDAARIGVVATVGSVAAALAAFPASALSDRVGRRLVMIVGAAAALVATIGFIATADLAAILVFAVVQGAANQAIQVVAVPYMTEHSEPEHRSELFAVQYALTSATSVVAAGLGGVVARAVAERLGFGSEGPETYRVILVFMGVLLGAALLLMLRLGDDRPSLRAGEVLREAGEPARFPILRRGFAATRLGLTIRNRAAFVRLLMPGLLIAIGAGQVIPFLNLFVQAKFGLDLAALNGVFAVTSLGTMLAILFQPALARRLGRLRSVVLVQAASIPFLLVLGFSPVLWSVIAAMAVRNSLMNAGNPIFNAFAMDQVSAAERATLAAAMSLMWSVGWVLAGAYYSIVHAVLGFEAGYAVNFGTIIVLYSVATWLLWTWFRDAEPAPGGAGALRPAGGGTSI